MQWEGKKVEASLGGRCSPRPESTQPFVPSPQRSGALRFALPEGKEILQEGEGVPPSRPLLWGSLRGRSCPLPTACKGSSPPRGTSSAPGACGRGTDPAGSQPATHPSAKQQPACGEQASVAREKDNEDL